jgi:diguanylate cyclase (GGDEF)-like protein/PAS domain S-box-containing protein
MQDRELVWVTDRTLQITSLTARLRDLLHVDAGQQTLEVGGLWNAHDPFGIAVVAHRWALEGEPISFDTNIDGRTYGIRLDPLVAPNGTIAGVAGCAAARAADDDTRTRLQAYAEAEGQSGSGSWHRDLAAGKLTVSGGLAQLLGLDDSVGLLDVRAFDHPEDRELVARAISLGEINGEGYNCEHRIVRADGAQRMVRERLRTIYNDDGIAVAQVGSLLDITAHKQREAELQHLAHYDSLTKLPNRALLEERLRGALTRAERTHTRCAVLFIDLDDFKHVNDRYGHPAGDELLEMVGRRLERQVRSSDTVARPSGDEFVIVLEDLQSDEAAVEAARKILSSFDERFTVQGASFRINASIGIAVHPPAGRTAAELIRAADHEMYVVKRNGGRGVKLAPPVEESGASAGENEECTNSSTDRHRFAILKNA